MSSQTPVMIPNFRDPNTQVRINPDTYIKFDGSDHVMISNVSTETAMSIKSDILLLLWDLVNWKTVGELCEPWPPEDQEKIKTHLENLHTAKIVVCDESELREATESGLSEKLGKGIHINVENHHNMLRDFVRTAAYRRAIERNVTPDTIAMDLGCGSGILSFFAARAGAKKVFAIERRPDIIELARAIAEDNNLDQQIEFVEGMSNVMKESQIEPKANLFISEILGNAILEENVLEFTMDARKRFLTPDAKMIPAKLDMYVFAYQSETTSEKRLEVAELKDLYGIDFKLLGDVMCSKTSLRVDRYNPVLNTTMSHPVLFKTIDFKTMENTLFTEQVELPALKDGLITGFCCYFKAWLDEDTTLTNSPWAPMTHWTQMLFVLAEPKPVKADDAVKLELFYDGHMRLTVL
ncbi:MAG: 50S ribosomal protein L11 methyltransferase [Cyanobacteria bacterium]|nr:50S ribosomal protein L11 methyltransferase [Cyanobacteriota bacterium]